MNNTLLSREIRAYLCLTSLVICGLAGSLITATKVVTFGINFPFSNVIFSVLTYPIVDCICEIWGKRVAIQTMLLGLISQLFISLIIQLSVIAPPAAFWPLQDAYHMILSKGIVVVSASVVAFGISQFLDIIVYQRIKELTNRKWLWLRTNISTFLGQIIDSGIFVFIIFFNTNQKLEIFLGSITVKIILSFCMTPIVYLIVFGVNALFDFQVAAN